MVSKNLAKGDMKKIMTISIIGYAACYASYSFATSPIHLYISALLLGVFYLNATLIPVSMMVTNWFVKQRGLAMSLAMAGIGVGGGSLLMLWLTADMHLKQAKKQSKENKLRRYRFKCGNATD